MPFVLHKIKRGTLTCRWHQSDLKTVDLMERLSEITERVLLYLKIKICTVFMPIGAH